MDQSADRFFNGLTDEEVRNSRQIHGSNELTKKSKNSFFKQYLASFGDPIIKILMIALFVNILFMFKDANWYETIGIALAVLLATFVSTLSEYGSESAFEKLQEDSAKIKCRVKRFNGVVELPIGEIVVGDLLLVQAGERIVADGRLVSGDINVDQSALNGETKEAHKIPKKSEKNGDNDFMNPHKLFRGSVVCSGNGMMLVENIGDHTFYGKLAIEVQEETIESPLKERLSHLAMIISYLGYIAAVLVFVANLFNTIVIDNHFNPLLIKAYVSDYKVLFHDLMHAVTLAITVIVMAVPEGLPMMITVVLSSNMKRMLKDNVLVRKLVGIETSGSLNILFTDKTGTLTKGKLEVTTFIDGSGKEFHTPELLKNPEIFDYLKLSCFYNNDAQISYNGKERAAIGGNSTDRALLQFIMEEEKRIPEYQKGFTLPFHSENKFAITEITGEQNLHLIKGAPEILLPHCDHYLSGKGMKKTFKNNNKIMGILDAQASKSVRLLAICISENKINEKHLRGLTLIGFLGIKDELRAEAKVAVRDITGAGIQMVMITGDNKNTAVAVAREAELLCSEQDVVLTSAELNKLSDFELKKILPSIRVIARALPTDKSRLVRISQELGLVTGMTGDGVNDAPALKKADVGFAMGDGTEIAKEAGDVVILDNNISSIVKAILYGRTVFKSIRKFIVFQLTVNLCAVAVSVIGPFIGVEAPVTVIQMLWINIIMDTLGGLAYAGEPPLQEYLKEKPKKREEKIINSYMFSQIAYTGTYTTLLCILFLKLPVIRSIFRQEEIYIMTAFFALFIFTGIFNSFNARTSRMNLFAHLSQNKAFVSIMLLITVIQIFFIYYGGTVFQTAGLKLQELLFVILMAFSVVLADMTRKIFIKVKHI